MCPKRGNIYLTGFMGSGKTTIGRILALKLCMGFVDTDLIIEKKSGKSINEIFREDGEKVFRNLERSCIEEVTKMNRCVIALGGGTIIDRRNLDNIKASGLLINLRCNPELISDRLKEDNARPLLKTGGKKLIQQRIRNLIKEREKYYNMAHITINVKGDSPPEEICETIIESLKQKNIRYRTDDRS
ncbi:MAG: shikimate kinase [Fidelibacterota bacterium]